MKKHNKAICSLLGIVIVLIAVLLFVLGYNSRQENIQNDRNKTTRITKKATSSKKDSDTTVVSSSSSLSKKEELSYRELAIAAYINTLRGDSIEEKLDTFNECVNGESPNPSTEQPTSFEQHNDPTFQVNEGDMAFAWDIISFDGDSIDVEHFTHGEKDSSKSFSKSDVEEKYSDYKSQLNEAIQKIDQNQQNVQDSEEDDNDEE